MEGDDLMCEGNDCGVKQVHVSSERPLPTCGQSIEQAIARTSEPSVSPLERIQRLESLRDMAVSKNDTYAVELVNKELSK
jgi:hypothetical protein